tara:strand:- start:120 stop:1472 length:1353 start_codon:yes stop_codon:yes gene_type:complete
MCISDENLKYITGRYDIGFIKQIYSENNNIREKLANYIISSDKEKQTHDEYSTPPFLVDNLISKVPPLFLTKPKKIYEPCVGKGNILLGLFDVLFNSLEDYCGDIIERCRIIIEECLYFSDINENNILIVKDLLLLHAQSYCSFQIDYKINCYCGDSLDLDIQRMWGIPQFDCIISNPPFNVPQTSKNKGGGNSLWKKFILKSINHWLIDGGYMITIHPSGWRKPASSGSKYNGLFKLLTEENQMIYLNMNDNIIGKKTFNCSTNFDWYIIQKKKKYTYTYVNDWKNNDYSIDMGIWDFLPNYNINKIARFLSNGSNCCNILYDRSKYGGEQEWVQYQKDSTFQYPLIHNTSKKGPTLHYSSRNDNGHYGIKKVIFGDSGIHNSILDIKGEYGMTHHSMAIVDDESVLPDIKKVIDSEDFKDILKCCSWSKYQIDWRLFLYFRKDFWKYI